MLRSQRQIPAGRSDCFAGGLNLYAYAGNNPATYTDPFGLCVKGDINCEQLVTALRAEGAQAKNSAIFTKAADAFDAYQGGRLFYVSGGDKRLTGPNKAGTVGGRVAPDGNIYINASFGKGDRLVTGVHESLHLRGYPDDSASPELRSQFRSVEAEAYRNLSSGSRATAFRTFNYLTAWGYTLPYPVTEK
jgi:hypothetical protein